MNVLISLHRGYGMGDAVQVSVILEHIEKYRPHWKVDFQAQDGQHCIGHSRVNKLKYGGPKPIKKYDAEFQVCLTDRWHGFTDRPNTHVVACLCDTFGIDWDIECGRYKVTVSPDSIVAAHTLVCGIMNKSKRNVPVLVHYQGDSSLGKKNLTSGQAFNICHNIEEVGGNAIILDWRNQSPIVEYRRVTSPQHWGPDAEMNCAVISQCAAFVGIDSGPAKCAATTDTPSLVVWTGHHPAQFFDLAPNVTHLIPADHAEMYPVCGDRKVLDFFNKRYRTWIYDGDPVDKVAAWLREVLR